MKKKIAFISILVFVVIFLSSCALFHGTVNELRGDITGNTYTIDTFDNFGKKVMTIHGTKINVTGNIVHNGDVH